MIVWNRQTGEMDMEGLNGQKAIKDINTAMENKNIEEQIRVSSQRWSVVMFSYTIPSSRKITVFGYSLAPFALLIVFLLVFWPGMLVNPKIRH